MKGIFLGLLLGFGTNGLCVLISLLMGDIKLSYSGFDWKLLIAFLIFIFIQSSSEEVTDRIYLYQKLRRRYRSPLAAILINSIVFMAMHMSNPGFTWIAGMQIFLAGFIWSLLVYYYDSVWVAFWFHTAWNYTQNIIFGLPNSGIVSEYSIFKLEAATATNGLFYDVKFGVEGSIGSSIILGVLLIVLIIINRRKGEKTDIWEAAEETAAEKREADQRRKEKYQSKHAAS
jgi:membrane protease YdiL (CAAX protease family)